VFAVREGDPVSLCCAARVPMRRIDQTDLWSVTLRVKGLDRAVLDILVARDPANTELPQYRGRNAAPAPVFAASLQGKLVEEGWDSVAAGERRKASVYTPPGFDPTKRYPVVYLADGYVLEGYARLVEPLILSGDLRPVVMVGLWPNQGDPAVNWRRLDWQVGVDPERFARVEQVLLKEVIPLAEAKYGASSRRQDRLIYGTSAGAAWSAVMAARHPEVFGHAAAFSLGWGPAADAAWRTGPRLYLAAGTLEPDYLRVASELATRARAAGREVRLDTPVAGHSFTTWQPRMIEAIRWAFGTPKD
jgi:enterochelin esterase family protein